ncbi:MAG: NHL repeat-containing protein [Cystobacterineae bacterium]|nr:NHL repeat-containing protein [Cystobacterineae bacterium]
MKAQRLSQAFVFALWVSACHIPGTCKVGNNDDCQGGAVCVGGKEAEIGDDGVCAYVSLESLVGMPVISGFSPLEARFGEELSIFGNNFSMDVGENVVKLNEVEVEVVRAEVGKLSVVVPKNKACSGPISVTTTRHESSKTATSAEHFSYVLTVTVSTFAGSGIPGNADGPGEEAQFRFPEDIAIDSEGNLYVTDSNNHRIRKVAPDGEVSTLAGGTVADGPITGNADGPGEDARFYYPRGITIDAQDTLYVADSNNHRIRKMTRDGVVETLAGDGFGYLDDVGTHALFGFPYGIAIDSEGNLYVTDSGNHRIRKVAPDREVSTLAGGTVADGPITGDADGPGEDARFYAPHGIVIDAQGALYVSDSSNHRIRRVTPQGEVETFLGDEANFLDGAAEDARLYFPYGMAIDASGNLYVVDNGNQRIRKVTPQGEASTLAGDGTLGQLQDGIGSYARFNSPHGISLDLEGNLYVADYGNHCIRKIVLE